MRRMLESVLWLAAAGIACDSNSAPPAPPASSVPAQVFEASGLQRHFEETLVGGAVALTDPETATWINTMGADALILALDEAGELDTTRFEQEAGGRAQRIVLQNDIWGLWQRASGAEPSIRTQRVAEACATVIERLAVDRRADPLNDRDTFPAAVAPYVRGFRRQESEMPSLLHEAVFGARRVFYVAVRGAVGEQQFALYSTLVALDENGAVYQTDIAGDLEMLRFDGETLINARAFELRRDHLGAGASQPLESLHEVFEISRVPGLGTNAHVARFDPAERLSDLPCASCHDDASPNSLPSTRYPLGDRDTRVLQQALSRAPTW